MEEQSPRTLVAERMAGGRGTTGTLARLLRDRRRRAWRFFCSVQLAIILILVLTGLSLIGTLLIQVPPGVTADPGEYAWWRENVVRPTLGIWTTPLAFLGLFDVFHSPWFLGAGSLLVVNILACSINRWKSLRAILSGGRIKLADRFYEGGANRAEFSGLEMTPTEAGAVVVKALERRRYRIRLESTPQGVCIAADKNRYFRLGTYFHHLSLVLFIVGFLIGSFLGFRSQSFAVPEGSVRDVGYGTNLSLKLESFVDEYWPEGPPKDYRSQVVLYENGQEVQQGLLRVNHPMSYKGVRFYQSFFGPAVVMEVRDQSGQLLYNDGVALSWTSGEKPYKRPTGLFSVPGTGVTAYVVAPAQGYYDPLMQAGT
ncbi:MAG: cytochrome c biogenesis protein ResB, partial [Chloroflexi bacterium]|nr:cytochrome c biogenesis protein ResB [Chloroflexota bacterium]